MSLEILLVDVKDIKGLCAIQKRLMACYKALALSIQIRDPFGRYSARLVLLFLRVDPAELRDAQALTSDQLP